MKNLINTFVVIALVVTTSGATLNAKERTKFNPWLDCGIGAMIFPETDGAAGFSNIIWDLGTTAVTSALSSKGTCKGSLAKAAMFINESYVALAEETSVGSGQHVTAMLDILGCNSASQAAITQAVRTDFAQAVSARDYTSKTHAAKAQQYYNIVDAAVSGEFAEACNI